MHGKQVHHLIISSQINVRLKRKVKNSFQKQIKQKMHMLIDIFHLPSSDDYGILHH